MEIVRKLLVCGVLLTGGAANAAEQGFYFGVLGGQAEYQFDDPRPIPLVAPPPGAVPRVPIVDFGPLPPGGSLNPGLFPPSFTVAVTAFVSPLFWPADADDEAGAWGATVGYRIFRYAAVELNYLNLGTLERTEPLLIGPPPFTAIAEINHELETTGPAASALGVLPLSKNWELYARVGVFFADMEATTSIVNSSVPIQRRPSSITFGSEALLWGGGVQFNWGDHWTLRVDFQRFESVGEDNGAGEADIDLLSFGVLFRL
jgi:hypothetical protein